jgi:ABC-type multidrug transport system ATPase subunit
MSVLETFSLSKRFGKIRAVRSLDLSVQQGNIYGILGPNGSGKTTTLGMILGVIHPDQGTFTWFGEPPTHLARRRIGVLLETPSFYPSLSAEKNLAVVASIKGRGMDRIELVLKQVGLYERRNSPIQTYSLGMRQRMALAAALLTDPEVLVLDEPTNGLDPQGIADVRHIIQAVGEQGTTIIMASHILDEVEKVCTHVAVIKQGQLLAAGDITQVLQAENRILVGAADLNALREKLAGVPGILTIRPKGPLLELVVNELASPAEVNRQLSERGMTLSHLQLQRKGLEETFLELVADDGQTA